ncbi:hypothetical protein Slin_1038 [Spirosoma linguale DSM 74]|uniref:Uncharacterized protein n=1 Tax=Spirosoma linguale (strain ATCC 33905 / DSM 74 / LMG 10896 / Claus 1) TaxID=504472 RepID=D2QJW7_SPILD|nr:hypothetical protein Slin_1038 [Spirosoma linguale DSM 74]
MQVLYQRWDLVCLTSTASNARCGTRRVVLGFILRCYKINMVYDSNQVQS